MPRAGLTTGIVVREGADLADAIGYDSLTLTALASRLGVAVPSLYKHVGSLDDLRRGVALMAIRELGDVLRTALQEVDQRPQVAPTGEGQARGSEIHALAAAYRGYALEHPGRYAATVRATPPGDRALQEASDGALRVVFELLAANGLRDDDLVHAARSLRAALHGFATLEAADGFGLAQSVESSFEWMVDAFSDGLAARATRARG